MSAYDEDYGVGGGEGGEGYEEVDKEDKKDDTEALITKEEAPPKSPQPSTSVTCCCLLWSFIWLIVLVAFAWPFSVLMSTLYGFVAPLITLIGLGDISDFMLQAVNMGRECSRNVRTGKPIA